MSEDANLAYDGNPSRSRYVDQRYLERRPSDLHSFVPLTSSPRIPSQYPTSSSSPELTESPLGVVAFQAHVMPKHHTPAWQPAAIPTTVETIEHKLAGLKTQLGNLAVDHVAVVRLASHVSILFVAGIILLFSRVELPALDASIGSLTNEIVNVATFRPEVTATALPENQPLLANVKNLTFASLSLPRWVVPFTVKPVQPVVKVTSYLVQSGDTVFGIATKLGLKPETLQWSNPTIETNPDLLRLGESLKVPPTDGAIHSVKAGETLLGLAQKYKVSPEAIVGFVDNQLLDTSAPLIADTAIFIPGGIKPYEPVVAPASVQSGISPIKQKFKITVGTGVFSWPAIGEVSQGYWGGHRALDIAGWTGNPVKAADTGTVVEASGGWSYGYGNHVIVDHGNGYQTLYAHLSSIWVNVGETVTKGQQLGAVGNTGRSTGPHLHFEVRYQGVTQNPFSYLR